MNLTQRQYDYAIHLMQMIGYTDLDVIEELLKLYEKKYSRIEFYFNGIKRKKKVINYSIDVLVREIEIKEKIEIKNIDYEKYISATDLASFNFCKASYSIANSFLIPYLNNYSNIEEGTELHNELRLLYKKKYFGFKDDNIYNFSNHQKKFLKKIKSCELLFKGHKDENHFFINDEKKYIGQPDYIFLDPNNDIFIVEEKYHYKSRDRAIKYSNNIKFKNKDFFDNNLIQLQSYIDYIKEYDVKYGVLINWYYYINEDEDIIIYDFTFKILRKNQKSELLEATYNELMNFRNDKSIDFDKNVNLNKCVNCSVVDYCFHKTKNKTILELPYNK
jgi:hypothetical protein